MSEYNSIVKKMSNVMAPMRDGTLLACDVFRPDDDRPYPAILLRTPYNKEHIDNEFIYSNYMQMAESGYNMVFQDVRGTGASEGFLDATGASEEEDGYDTIEWIASQQWCDGNVGMQGLSYFGFTQMAAAAKNPPHLKAICPFQHSAIYPFSLSAAGTFGIMHLAWVYSRALANLEKWFPDPDLRDRIREQIELYTKNWAEEMFKLPVKDARPARIPDFPQIRTFLELIDGVEDPSFMSRARRPVKISEIKAPMFMLTGWFDAAKDGTIDNWLHACPNGVPDQNHKLIVGPWLHGGGLKSAIDGRDYGDAASGEGADIQGIAKRWFDHWLKGADNGITREPRVWIYVLGDNTWREEAEWPPRRAKETAFYLHRGADKNAGRLVCAQPGDQEPQSYVYDPDDPLPSRFEDAEGRTVFADAGVLDSRRDVLVFTSEALAGDIDATGLVRIRLYASTDARDTDFYCKLSDVDENGYAFPLVSGITRGRFRNGKTAEFLEPGRIYEFTFDLGYISNVFKKNHKIKAQISSSCYPEHDRNLNTTDRIGYGTYSVKATQVIYHDAAHPSCLLLPVITHFS